MKYNRQDIIEAWYLVLVGSPIGTMEHERFIKIVQKHNNKHFLVSSSSLTDNGKAIYKQTCKNLLLNRSYF